MKKMTMLALGVALLSTTASLVASPPSAASAAKSASADYATLLAPLKAGDTNIDFVALRAAYVKTPEYKGSGRFDRKAAYEAMDTGKYDVALKLAEQRLAKSYMDIDAHMLASFAQEKLGNADRAAFEHRVAQGMIDAILLSGDGKKPETAFKVIDVPEEYIIISLRRLKLTSQSLVTKDGAFDMMNVTDVDGLKADLWFDISSFFGKSLS